MSIDVLVSHFTHWTGGSATCARSPLANARGPEPGPERIARRTSPPAQPVTHGLEAARRRLVLTGLVGGDIVPGNCAKGSEPGGPAVIMRAPTSVGRGEGGSVSCGSDPGGAEVPVATGGEDPDESP